MWAAAYRARARGVGRQLTALVAGEGPLARVAANMNLEGRVGGEAFAAKLAPVLVARVLVMGVGPARQEGAARHCLLERLLGVHLKQVERVLCRLLHGARLSFSRPARPAAPTTGSPITIKATTTTTPTITTPQLSTCRLLPLACRSIWVSGAGVRKQVLCSIGALGAGRCFSLSPLFLLAPLRFLGPTCGLRGLPASLIGFWGKMGAHLCVARRCDESAATAATATTTAAVLAAAQSLLPADGRRRAHSSAQSASSSAR